MVNMNLKKIILQSNILYFAYPFCNRKLAKSLPITSRREFFGSPKRNVKITDLLVVQNFSSHEFPERIFSRFISSSP